MTSLSQAQNWWQQWDVPTHTIKMFHIQLLSPVVGRMGGKYQSNTVTFESVTVNAVIFA